MVDIVASELSILQEDLERLARRRMMRGEEPLGGLAPAAQEACVWAAVDREGEEDEDEVQEEEQEKEEAEDEETEDYEGQEEEPLQAAVEVQVEVQRRPADEEEPDPEPDPPSGGAATGAAVHLGSNPSGPAAAANPPAAAAPAHGSLAHGEPAHRIARVRVVASESRRTEKNSCNSGHSAFPRLSPYPQPHPGALIGNTQ